MTSPSRRRSRFGFTLVELLVVIGIIALLIGILLPTLSRARESANAVKCGSNMRQFMSAVVIYGNENDGFLAGPHTSGQVWGPSGLRIASGVESDPESPLQNVDWMSPSLGLVLGDLPSNDVERLQRLFETDMECPTVNQVFSSYYLGDDIAGINASDIRYSSYSAIIQFHTDPARERKLGSMVPRISAPISEYSGTSYPYAAPPPGYSPKLAKVGPSSSKAFAIEGARYLETSGPVNALTVADISFNALRYQVQGGNYMVRGPFYFADRQPHQLITNNGLAAGNYTPSGPNQGVTEPSLALGWRHGGLMNIAFFDGHIEKLAPAESIDPSMYLPKGSRVGFQLPGGRVVNGSQFTYDPDDSDVYEVE